MAELHERWLDEPGPTDVMSFPMDEYDSARRPDAPSSGPALLGDIVLCPAFAADQAATAGHGLDDELHLLTVHGVLHLLGYDHAEPDEERTMFGLQAELLADWRTQRAAAARSRPRARPRTTVCWAPSASGTTPPAARRGDRVAGRPARRGDPAGAPGRGVRGGRRGRCRRCPAPGSTPWSARGRRARRRSPRSSPTVRATSTCSCCCGWPARRPPRCSGRSSRCS